MIAIETLAQRFEPFYAGKDTMHDLSHVRRIHASAVALAARAGLEYQPSALLLGAFLHGVIYDPVKAVVAEDCLRELGVSAADIDRAAAAARESQTDAVPSTPEGLLLHDGHLLEGGRTFQVVKTLVTGAARGATLAEIVSYWERNVHGRYRCFLPVAQSEYAERESFAKAVFAELRSEIRDSGSPAA
jgi:uncharacterized protein